ncbi:MAG: hypothetical protein J6031_05635, partial [Bacteroidales bacterium]|nr:hypothetical protein [Bacteroidales bacterium]
MRKLRILFVILPLLAFIFAGCSSPEKQEIDSGSIIIGHVTDSHTWHICDYKSKDGNEHSVAVNLPIILIDEGHLEVFSSKRFHHGHETYQGKNHTYALIGGGLEKEEIVCVEGPVLGCEVPESYYEDGEGNVYYFVKDAEGNVVKPVDISITKTAAAIIIVVTLLIVIILASAKKYKVREGKAPKGMQSLIEIL